MQPVDSRESAETPAEERFENSLYCYRDSARLCRSDCMAYLLTPPEGKDYEGQPWAHCVELVSNFKSAKHLTILTERVSNHVLRQAQLPIPQVR